MAESVRELENALRDLGGAVQVPPPPALASAVVRELREHRAHGRRAVPPLPLWPRRRMVVTIAVALTLIAGAALAAKLAIGAITVHVVPTPTTPRPSEPAAPGLGHSVSLVEAEALAGFRPSWPPSLGVPRHASVVESFNGSTVVVLAWPPSEDLPLVGGTRAGLILMELPGQEELAFKELVAGLGTLRTAEVGGGDAFWITGAHDLVLRTAEGERRFYVRGNVLVWTSGGLTFRMETTLGRRAAIALAGTIV